MEDIHFEYASERWTGEHQAEARKLVQLYAEERTVDVNNDVKKSYRFMIAQKTGLKIIHALCSEFSVKDEKDEPNKF